MTPFLIGIAGPSCSGKSELANHLLTLCSERGAVIISLDSYYRDLSMLDEDERRQWNFDVPAALDYELLLDNLTQLSKGKSVEKPVYLFPSHTRAETGETVKPAEVIIIEGLFTLYWEDIRNLLDLKIFVETGDDICLERRKQRDTAQRKRSVESIIQQYELTVRPMFQRYIHPTSEFADLILNGEQPIDSSGEIVRQQLKDRYE